MLKHNCALILFIAFSLMCRAQTPSARITDWSKAGLQDSVPVYSNVVDIMNYGGVKDSTAANNLPFQNALNALGSNPGTIYFPAGAYLFTQPISIPNNVVIKGAGKTSRLYFDLGNAAQNMINIQGNILNLIWYVGQPIAKNDSTLILNNATGLSIGDWVIIYGNDSNLVTSPWAYESVGQIFRITNIQGNTVTSDHILRMDYPLSFTARLKKIQPVSGAGIECLYIERKDTTASQTVNINMTYAVNCWITGVESYKTNFAHIGLTDASHILIRGNYIHHSHAYGGNGQGYGVMAQYTTGDCLVENNTFNHLRHSMLVHLGANGNVFGYNYSTDAFRVEVPNNASGDAVCHGNYPYLNLFEGNIVQQIFVDDSHGINGPFNTFFRNRAELYGILSATTPPTDSTNYMGNEITNTGSIMGLYSITGNGNYEFGNNVKGIIKPAGTSGLQDYSLYRTKAPGFWKAMLSWPNIGTPYPYKSGDIPARLKWVDSSFTDCTINPKFDGIASYHLDNGIKVYPNPACDYIIFDAGASALKGKIKIIITDISGKIVSTIYTTTKAKITLSTHELSPGIYLYKLQDDVSGIQTGRITIMR
jgi:hypothetical protein